MFLPRVFLHHGHKHRTTGSLGLLRRCLRRGCCRFCVKGFHFEGLKMLGNVSKFKISSNLEHQPGPNPKLLSDMTCHWPFWPNSELSKLHFTHEGMPNTSWIELGATSMMDKQIKVKRDGNTMEHSTNHLKWGADLALFTKFECLQRALRPLPEHNDQLELQKLNSAKHRTLSNLSTVYNLSITTHQGLWRIYIYTYISIVFLPDCLANTEFTVEMTFLLARRLALLDLSVVHVEECFVLLQRTRLFLSL